MPPQWKQLRNNSLSPNAQILYTAWVFETKVDLMYYIPLNYCKKIMISLYGAYRFIHTEPLFNDVKFVRSEDMFTHKVNISVLNYLFLCVSNFLHILKAKLQWNKHWSFKYARSPNTSMHWLRKALHYAGRTKLNNLPVEFRSLGASLLFLVDYLWFNIWNINET